MVGSEVAIGKTVAEKYQIIDLLGKGGMANVWLARDERLGKLWAIKEIKPNTEGVRGEVFRSALIEEVNLMKRLDHPAIPRVVDVLDTGRTTFVVMDYVEGRSLSTVLRAQGGPFGQERVVAWGLQLCDVLDYLHSFEAGIVYRDMKPANVILRDDDTLRLIDFGIALERGKEADGQYRMVGTPGYAAPEQLLRKDNGVQDGRRQDTSLDGRADVYALGATLYTLVSGHTPTLLRDSSGKERVSFDIRPIRMWDPRLSEGLEHVIAKATAPDPRDRYQTVLQMRYDLEHYEQLTREWRDRQSRKVARVRHKGVLSVAAAITGAVLLGASSEVGHSTFESVMHEARTATRSANADEPSEAERLATRAMGIEPGSVDPYRLLLEIYEDDYKLSDAESRRLQRAFGASGSIANEDGYAQLCFDVGVCYLSYYGIDKGGGSVGNAAIASSRAAVPWFDRALDASSSDAGESAGASSGLQPADSRAASTFRAVAGFFDETSRASKEGRAAQQSYRQFWDALARGLDQENGSPDAWQITEGMRARLCQIGVEALASPTYLAGLARSGVSEQEVRLMIERIHSCLEGLSPFEASEDYAEVYGPIFEEIREGLGLLDANVRMAYENPVALA